MKMAQLPQPATAFVGRERELSEIAELLADPNCRLLTIIGPGGIGKTRLAIQAAERQVSHFASGVSFAALTSLDSADFLPYAIGAALGLPFYSSEDPLLKIMSFLRDQQILLVMDNFEHLLDGVGCLADLLEAAPQLKILVTSRERLNLSEEWVFSLGGLAYPDPFPAEPAGKDRAGQYSAVELFIQRARQNQHHFAFDQHRPAVLDICRQVEGMPLGLELAAGWLRVMTCEQIAAQMTNSLDFLSTTLRNVPERHRSLRMIFEQSWHMLSADEQAVLARLSVFRGGCNLAAAVEVASAALATLAGLVDQSMLRVNEAGRYDLHELVRQFAGEKLAESGEYIATAQRHLAHFMTLAEEGEAHVHGGEQVTWYDRLEAEMDNFRAALAWSLDQQELEPRQQAADWQQTTAMQRIASGLRTAAALRWVWEMRGHLPEGLEWFNRLLPISGETLPAVRSRAFHRGCEIAGQLANRQQARVWAEEALRLARLSNDPGNIAWSLSAAAFFAEPDLGQAAAMLEESLALFRKLDDPFGLSHALRRLAGCAFSQNNYAYAAALLEQALASDRPAGDRNATAWELCFLGIALWSRYHQPEQVIMLYQESLALFREIQDIRGTTYPLAMLAEVERAQGHAARALALYQETLRIERGLGMCTNLAVIAIAGIGSLAAAARNPKRAARLLRAVHIALESGAYNTRFPPLIEILESTAAGIRARLGEKAFTAAWTSGKPMPLEQAMIEALQEEPASELEASLSGKNSQPGLLEPLSPRELEVVRLLGAGLSNAEIGQKLFISTATVKVHTRSIYGKLNVSNRAQAILQAQKLNLL